MAWGASLGGKIFLDQAKRYDVRFMATYGNGIGRYVGLNFAPDAIWVPGTSKLERVKNLAAMGAIRLGWTPTLRSTVMASFQNANYPGGFAVGTGGFSEVANGDDADVAGFVGIANGK